jgi:hypothetical protein
MRSGPSRSGMVPRVLQRPGFAHVDDDQQQEVLVAFVSRLDRGPREFADVLPGGRSMLRRAHRLARRFDEAAARRRTSGFTRLRPAPTRCARHLRQSASMLRTCANAGSSCESSEPCCQDGPIEVWMRVTIGRDVIDPLRSAPARPSCSGFMLASSLTRGCPIKRAESREGALRGSA